MFRGVSPVLFAWGRPQKVCSEHGRHTVLFRAQKIIYLRMGQTIDSKYTFELNNQIITKLWYKKGPIGRQYTIQCFVQAKHKTNIGWCTPAHWCTPAWCVVYTRPSHWCTLVCWVYTSVGSWCTPVSVGTRSTLHAPAHCRAGDNLVYTTRETTRASFNHHSAALVFTARATACSAMLVYTTRVTACSTGVHHTHHCLQRNAGVHHARH